jgi:hypothetical protein
MPFCLARVLQIANELVGQQGLAMASLARLAVRLGRRSAIPQSPLAVRPTPVLDAVGEGELALWSPKQRSSGLLTRMEVRRYSEHLMRTAQKWDCARVPLVVLDEHLRLLRATGLFGRLAMASTTSWTELLTEKMCWRALLWHLLGYAWSQLPGKFMRNDTAHRDVTGLNRRGTYDAEKSMDWRYWVAPLAQKRLECARDLTDQLELAQNLTIQSESVGALAQRRLKIARDLTDQLKLAQDLTI